MMEWVKGIERKTYIYIYIYLEVQRKRERTNEKERTRERGKATTRESGTERYIKRGSTACHQIILSLAEKCPRRSNKM